MYVSHLTTIIRQREEWIIANEARMKHPETTNAADISELEKKIKELEVSYEFSHGDRVIFRNFRKQIYLFLLILYILLHFCRILKVN